MFIDPLATNLAFLPLQLSRNTLEHVIDPADTSITDRSGLRYYLELLVPEFTGSSNFERLVKMPGSEKPPLAGNGSSIYEGCFYQINELLDGFLDYQKPAPATADMCILSTLTMPYMAKESIENNGVLLAGSSKDVASKWLLKAGLSEADFAGWGTAFFTTYLSQSRQFLTWQPDNKLVSPGQEEYLYYLLNLQPTPTTLLRRARLTHQNGLVETLTLGTLTGGQPYQVVCVPVGPTALALPDTVARYEVWLSDADLNRISQVRTYQIDRQFRSQQRAILFSNSLGGWDTLRLLGEGSETLTTQRATAERERPAGAPADFAELRVIYIQGARTLTVSTGYFEQQASQYANYLDELLLAKEVYLVDERGHQPLELTTNSLVDVEDNTDLLSRSFTFQFATPQLNHSSLPTAPATATRATGWRSVGIVHVLDSFGKRTGFGRPLKFQKYYLDDGSTYKPITEKPNQPGDPDYISSLPLPGVEPGSTPFPSQALSKPTTFKRATCGNGQTGDVAIITIPAARYGSEISQAEADGKAETEFNQLNTQAYADQFGTCTAVPELYEVAVAAGQWYYRTSDPTKTEIEWYQYGSSQPPIGNTWSLQGQNRAFVFPRYSHDFAMPVKASDWRLYVYGTANSQVNLKIYINGVLRVNTPVTLNRDGYEYLDLSALLTNAGASLASQNKLYVKTTPL